MGSKLLQRACLIMWQRMPLIKIACVQQWRNPLLLMGGSPTLSTICISRMRPLEAVVLQPQFVTRLPLENRLKVKCTRKKATDALVSLQKWLDNNPSAASGDRSAAENVMRDLSNALKGK